MKVAVFCPIGIEDILKKEILELTGKEAAQNKGICIVDLEEQEFVKLAYMSQSSERIGLLIKQGKVKDKCPTSLNIDNVNLSHIKEKFSINAKVFGSMPFNSVDVVTELSEKIKKKTDKIPIYRNADTKYYCYVFDEDYYLILDITTKDLTKRDYKVFVNKISLRGTIAYAVMRIADIQENDFVLDPFSRGGEIALEGMHYFMKKSLHYYGKERFDFRKLDITPDYDSIDKEVIENPNITIYATDSKMPNIKAAEKNAKIAGMNKQVNFSRLVIEDLDFKFDKNVTKIVTHLPAVGQHTEKGVLKLYKSFFNIANIVLKEKGTITCIGVKITPARKIAEELGFKLIHERNIMQGKENLKLYILKLNDKIDNNAQE